jgi:sterol 3beta-glucosyltransferase
VRVTVLVIGSRGDVHPMLALADGLARGGHDVTFATYEHFAALVRRRGIDCAVLPGDPVELMESDSSREIAGAGTSPLRYLRGLRAQARHVKAIAWEFLDCALETCRGTDSIVYGLTTLPGASIAEALGVPGVQAFSTLVTPTRSVPSMLSPRDISRGRYNLASHVVTEQVLWQPFRPLLNGWRAHIGLGPVPLSGPLRDADRRRVPLLYGFSPVVIPKPSDWGEWIEVTGYWFLPEPEWRASAALESFLASGPKPVCVDLSSVTGKVLPVDPKLLARAIVDGIVRAGRRALVLRGWSRLDPGVDQDALVHVDDYVPHEWLFPRVSIVLHAAGPGTLGAALRAGVPSITVPVMTDQPFWARRAARMGVAPPPLALKSLTPAQVTEAVHAAEAARARAETLGELIAREDGVARAVDAFESALATASPGLHDRSRELL